jgi:hypothetical protein
MNGKILELFMKENDAWDDMITRQSKEIPNLEKMLTSMVEKKPHVAEEILSSIRILKNEMQEQETSMTAVKEELAKQQDFLLSEKKVEAEGYGVHTLLSQNVLRERIRNVEKKFLDLKCNFLNYVASAF